ncbi:MAG: hypothetical protein DLD55_01530 [candidate division SR1 bacterium]|nr:MAG: hypothetical protein DLD55_01530 [candidate division SR1 bacterium]
MSKKEIGAITFSIFSLLIAIFAYSLYRNYYDKKIIECLNYHDTISDYIHSREELNDQQYNTIEALFYSKKAKGCLYFMKSDFVWANGNPAGEGYSLINYSRGNETMISWECWYEEDGKCNAKEKEFKKLVDRYR